MREQEDLPRASVWLLVLAVHGAMLWRLTQVPVRMPTASDEVRTQLVFIARAPPARPPELSPPMVTPVRPAVVFSLPRPSAPIAAPTRAVVPAPASNAETDAAPFDWQQQARESADRETGSDAPDFAADPLHSRRARLPGGTRADRFRMREPVSPARVLSAIGQLFGGPGDPCPRVHRNISGLLTATSDHARELLSEELRQYRDYCQP